MLAQAGLRTAVMCVAESAAFAIVRLEFCGARCNLWASIPSEVEADAAAPILRICSSNLRLMGLRTTGQEDSVETDRIMERSEWRRPASAVRFISLAVCNIIVS